MLITLPLVAFISVFVFCSAFIRDFRKNWANTSIILFSSVALMTEVMSRLGIIGREAIIVFWSLFAAVSFLLVVLEFKKISFRRLLESMGPGKWWFFKILIFILAMMLLIISVTASPNNWDSMTYHLGRIMHWIQNGSLNFYPTNILRQLNFPPFAEIVMMHLYLLTGNDLMMNLTQWFSYVSLFITTSLVYDELGGNPRGRFFVSVLAATIPMAVLQATSTQNDLLVSYLIILSIWRFFVLKKQINLTNLVIFSLAVGLTLYTKTTGYVYLFPLVIWTIYVYVKKSNLKMAFFHGMVFLLIVLSINGSQYIRNYNLWGNPFGTTKNDLHLNSSLNWKYLSSNLVRNTLMQLQSPKLTYNNQLYIFAQSIHDYIKVNLNDPNDTFNKERFFLYNQANFLFHPDYAPNPLHMLFIIIALFFIIIYFRKNHGLLSYSLFGLATFILFSLLLRWQPWQSRLLLPFFFIFCPSIAFVMESVYGKTSTVLMVIIIAITVPYVFNNSIRPLSGKRSIISSDRSSQYFADRLNVKSSYFKAVAAIKKANCKRIGLNINPDDYEYPIWAMLRDSHPVIEHYGVDNESKIYYKNKKYERFNPCAVIDPGEDGNITINIL